MHQVSSIESFGARLRRHLLAQGGFQANEAALFRTSDRVRTGMPPNRQTQNRSAPQDWSREFNALALELFSLQFAHNAAYRTFCASQGVVSPARLRHWRDIPAVPATAFKELELSCIPEEQRTKVFFSSGTTEDRPSRHFHNEASLQIYEASLLAWFKRHFPGEAFPTRSSGNSPPAQLDDAHPCLAGEVLALTPSPEQAPHSSLVHMFQTLRRLSFRGFSFTGLIGKAGAWRLDDSRTTELLQAAIDHQERVVLLGTAFSYVHLLDHMAERDLRFQLPEGSRVLETGGYKGRSRSLPKSELHKLITRRLGIPCSHIVCEYGMSELSSQAYDRAELPGAALPHEAPAQGWRAAKPRPFHFPPWTRVQIISPEKGREVQEGEAGLIRVFDLANVYSVMAVQTEDLGVRRGRGFELIGRAALAEPRGCSLMVS